MSKVFISEETGAAVYAFSNDHCPPHVHARHRGEGWTARLEFSFVTNRVILLSVAPLGNLPQRRSINRLLEEIRTRLRSCRLSWWRTQGTICLDDRWASRSDTGSVMIHSKYEESATKIAAAAYDPSAELVQLRFRDGTTAEMRAGEGRET
jgi:hypothetical protein